jgi:hypothetical protein
MQTPILWKIEYEVPVREDIAEDNQELKNELHDEDHNKDEQHLNTEMLFKTYRRIVILTKS